MQVYTICGFSASGMHEFLNNRKGMNIGSVLYTVECVINYYLRVRRVGFGLFHF